MKKDKANVLEKRYYILDTSSGLNAGFKREVYNLKDNDELKLVHYVGDHSLVVDFPHRNSKRTTGSYAMTLPSTLKSINDSCASKDAHLVYKEAVNSQKSDYK